MKRRAAESLEAHWNAGIDVILNVSESIVNPTVIGGRYDTVNGWLLEAESNMVTDWRRGMDT